jgi:DNA-directed RNA polymerase beta' subunit
MNGRYKESSAPRKDVNHVQFGILSADEIEAISVMEVVHTELFDRNLPKVGGLYDLRMGTIDKKILCQTCNCDVIDCQGHYGFIKLNEPVYNVCYIKTVYKVLNCVCVRCSRYLATPIILKKKKTSVIFRQAIDACKKIQICTKCEFTQPKITIDSFNIYFQFNSVKSQLSPIRAFNILRKISDEDCYKLGLNSKYAHPMNMIIQNLIVPPPVVRPSVFMNTNSRTQDDLTQKLLEILKNNIAIVDSRDEDREDLCVQLQYHVSTYLDNELPGVQQATQRTGRPIKSLCQRIRSKEGRVRGNLMGKRVDFSARTVITAEPNIRLDELGVPISIARNMTIKESVTSFNRHKLQEYVDNGPTPSGLMSVGANFVYNPELDGKKDLRFAKDLILEVGDVVERHLRDGDVVVFNRQPTLHKMSMMGHFVRKVTGDTFRLNLSATTPYNADFDGDEMNMHVPQSIEARVEVSELMMVSQNIVSPQSNKPVIGIVQDALLACRLATRRDVFLDKETIVNLLNHIDYFDIPVPAILKPVALWTGKQLFNCILPKNEIRQYTAWHSDSNTPWFSEDDTEVYIDNGGDYISGILCKKTIGPASNGVIHKAWLYDGPKAASDFISKIQVLANNWLIEQGFSVGIIDCINNQSAQTRVDVLIKESLDEIKNNPNFEERDINHFLNQARDRSGRYITTQMHPNNSLHHMVSSGSKGSVINIAQIMACVGQQNVNGQRISSGYTNRTLPHYPINDEGYESKGFVKNSYMKGLSPNEFFFHAMGGREGVIDTAIKTSETGYIQRRLVKAMEDIQIGYDNTVRNSLGEIVQMTYGEDGMDGSFLITQKIDGQLVHLPIDLDKNVKIIDRMTKKSPTLADAKPFITSISNRLHRRCCAHALRNVQWDEYQFNQFRKRYDEAIIRAIVSPGETVGTIAAQSLGQPITQMTLNTFHAAGISSSNVTLGVPRLKELINLTKSIRCPSMKIYTKQPVTMNDPLLCDCITLKDCVKRYIVVRHEQFSEYDSGYVELMDIPELKHHSEWVIQITLDTESMSRNGVTFDMLSLKMNTAIDTIWCTQNCDQLCVHVFKNSTIDTQYDLETLIAKLLHELIIKGYKNIKRIHVDENVPYVIVTDGSDLQNVLHHPLVNPLRTSTNDVLETLNELGLEAARHVLLRELKQVIEYDGSYLNYRHLSVLLDVMTHKGQLMAITRHGINRTETGVLMRCSFEETVNIIIDAAVLAEIDPVRGVTENIILGKLTGIGTGCVDILTNFDTICDDQGHNTTYFRPSTPTRRDNMVATAFYPSTMLL